MVDELLLVMLIVNHRRGKCRHLIDARLIVSYENHTSKIFCLLRAVNETGEAEKNNIKAHRRATTKPSAVRELAE